MQPAKDQPALLRGYEGLVAAVGSEFGASAWLKVEQARIDSFADVTGDHAWIHVDPIRAASGPYGHTIAHGLLTLSLITTLAGQTFRVTGLSSALHYGYDHVRFVCPVAVDSSIRARVSLAGVDGDAPKIRARYRAIVEVAGAARPACIADLIYFYVFDAVARLAPPTESLGTSPV